MFSEWIPAEARGVAGAALVAALGNHKGRPYHSFLRLILPEVVEVTRYTRLDTKPAKEPQDAVRIGPGRGVYAPPRNVPGSRSP